MILHELHDRIRTVEVFFKAAQAAAGHFIEVCRADPTHLDPTGLRVRDVRDCLKDLEDTYLIRAYAVFETALRDYWDACIRPGRHTHPRTEHLIDGVAARCMIGPAELTAVQTIRTYRNWLLHGGPARSKIRLGHARQWMCRFMMRLPGAW